MANHCSNSLLVSQTDDSNESKQQLRKFIDDIHDKGKKITLKEAEVFREKFLTEQFKIRYSNNAALFVEHSEMTIKDFMTKVVYYSYDGVKQIFTTDESLFSMDKLLPIPSELEQSLPANISKKAQTIILNKRKLKYGFGTAYDWVINNRGTKWIDANIDDFNDEGDSVTYTFTSAWSPPVEFLKNICEEYPLLDFSLNYEESGCGFEGDLEIVAGAVVLDETRDYVQKNCCECGEHIENLDEELTEEGYCAECKDKNEEEEDEN